MSLSVNGEEYSEPEFKGGRILRSVICVHEKFDLNWPFSADHWHERWKEQGDCDFYRTEDPDATVLELVNDPASVTRLAILGFSVDDEMLDPFSALEECYAQSRGYGEKNGILDRTKARGVSFIPHRVDVYWGQSVAEFGLAMTINALRRIPQTYVAMMESHETWQYRPEGGIGKPGQRGIQFGDTTQFVSGTLSGKRVRVVGVGSIGGRYASWCSALGADVAVWDPFAPDAAFRLANARREFHLPELIADAEIFVTMVPLTDDTRGMITGELVEKIPGGSLVVQVTRAPIMDTEVLYRRVINDELALAADVFDKEPLPLDSPLLGRHNVIHTPHNAGRTRDSNLAMTDDQIARFRPR